MFQLLNKVRPELLKGTVLLRLDFNTEDEWRLEAAIPTIKFLLRKADRIVILSHRGRPNGFEKRLSLKKDAVNLQRLLKKEVNFIPYFRFAEIKKFIKAGPRKSIFVLENLRFLKGEEENDRRLAKNLASLGDFYVNDAFAVSHRKNASVVALTQFLPSYAGLELEKEIKFLSHIMGRPKKPLVIILGGAKAHDKLGVLKFFRNKADWFLLGGAAANTLLWVRGADVKKSLIDTEKADKKMLKMVSCYKNLVLPVDYRLSQNQILDIGPKTEKIFVSKIRPARTIIWSGPLGMIEKKKFSQGTLTVAKAIAVNKKAFSVAGGGETVMFLKKHRLDKKFSFISTGGGAMLDFLAGEKLPGIEALRK